MSWLFVDRMYCPTPDFPVLHYLPKFAQTHVHWVSDVIQPSHPPSPPSPALNLSQHQSFPMSWLFASGGQSIEASASVSILPMNIRGWFLLGLTGLYFSKTVLLVMFQLYSLLPCNTCVCVCVCVLSLNHPRFEWLKTAISFPMIMCICCTQLGRFSAPGDVSWGCGSSRCTNEGRHPRHLTHMLHPHWDTWAIWPLSLSL